MDTDLLRSLFAERFGRECRVVARAPGRVNLIGEHTDYNDGFVLPIATRQETWVAGSARDDGLLRVFSHELADERSWSIDDWPGDVLPHWTSYVAGVAALLRRRGLDLAGAELFVRSTVPPGGGLSSSAALEVATALTLIRLAGATLSDAELIDLCRQAEHEFAGVPCGLMDQSVCVGARERTAFLLDCRTRQHEHIPCELGGHTLLVIDSGVRHELAAGEYARRLEQCRQAVARLRESAPAIRSLRDATTELVARESERLGPLLAARARHVVSENERTLAAAAALRAGRLPDLGRLMNASHRSLRDDYEVSCAELDALVGIVTKVDGVLGARLTGGGFGGCVIALARKQSTPAVAQALRERYDPARVQPARLLQTSPGRGASVEFAAE